MVCPDIDIALSYINIRTNHGKHFRPISAMVCPDIDITLHISIYTISDLVVLSNLIGSLSLANEHYSPPTE